MYEVASRYATNFAFSRFDDEMTASPLEVVGSEVSEGSGDGTASGPADVEASVQESEPT